MNAALITSIIDLITSVLLPNLNSSSAIAKVINTLVQAVPVIIQEVKDMVAPVQNIIAALRSNSAITPEQLDQLDKIEAQLDAAFDSAADAATQQDASGS